MECANAASFEGRELRSWVFAEPGALLRFKGSGIVISLMEDATGVEVCALDLPWLTATGLGSQPAIKALVAATPARKRWDFIACCSSNA